MLSPTWTETESECYLMNYCKIFEFRWISNEFHVDLRVNILESFIESKGYCKLQDDKNCSLPVCFKGESFAYGMYTLAVR